MKILVADDDKFSRFVLRGILRQEPAYEVFEAASGREAWEFLQQGVLPDLCILDMVMPDLTGLDLLRRLRADARFRTLKVILCSAVNERTTIAQAAALSINYYILKPYSRELILEQVRKVAQQLATPLAIEDPATVCGRLGIDRDTYLSLRQMLAGELQSGLQAVRRALEQADLAGAETRLNALKGAAANLGALGIVSRIAKTEALLSRETSGASPTGAADADAPLRFKAWLFIHGQEVFRCLDELEAEGSALALPATPATLAIPAAA
jgi:two-component system, chemotaxis family, chemotaxis protein CheY